MVEGLHAQPVGIHPPRRRLIGQEEIELVGVALLRGPRHHRPAVGPRRHRGPGDVELVSPAHVLVLEARAQGQVRAVRGADQERQRDRRAAGSHAHRHLQEIPP